MSPRNGALAVGHCWQSVPLNTSDIPHHGGLACPALVAIAASWSKRWHPPFPIFFGKMSLTYMFRSIRLTVTRSNDGMVQAD